MRKKSKIMGIWNKKYYVFLLLLVMGICLFTFYKKYEGKNILSVVTLNANTSYNWGLSFQKNNECPGIDFENEMLEENKIYYLGNEEKNKIYLTFDAGFENGNTEKILDALKLNNVKACFFLVGNYLEKNPELVKRMVEEGHIVGNHTYHHRDMGEVTQKEEFVEELESLEEKYKEITGQEMGAFYRPPQGKFTMEQINWAKEKGYKTIFWSLAYVDWEENNQPPHEEAMKKLTERIHPGSIVLLHSTSKTNGEIMDRIIKKWKEMGYTFGTLDELEEI